MPTFEIVVCLTGLIFLFRLIGPGQLGAKAPSLPPVGKDRPATPPPPPPPKN